MNVFTCPDEVRDRLAVGDLLVDANGDLLRVHADADPREYRDENVRGTYELTMFDTEFRFNTARDDLAWPLRRAELRVTG